MDGACGTDGRDENAHRILVAKPKEKGPVGRPRRRWENNIKMYLKDIEYNVVDSVAVAFSCERDNEPSGSERRISCSV
jgi:hypothetical protein